MLNAHGSVACLRCRHCKQFRTCRRLTTEPAFPSRLQGTEAQALCAVRRGYWQAAPRSLLATASAKSAAASAGRPPPPPFLSDPSCAHHLHGPFENSGTDMLLGHARHFHNICRVSLMDLSEPDLARKQILDQRFTQGRIVKISRLWQMKQHTFLASSKIRSVGMGSGLPHENLTTSQVLDGDICKKLTVKAKANEARMMCCCDVSTNGHIAEQTNDAERFWPRSTTFEMLARSCEPSGTRGCATRSAAEESGVPAGNPTAPAPVLPSMQPTAAKAATAPPPPPPPPPPSMCVAGRFLTFEGRCAVVLLCCGLQGSHPSQCFFCLEKHQSAAGLLADHEASSPAIAPLHCRPTAPVRSRASFN